MNADRQLRFLCHRCGKRLKAPAGSAGRRCTCPRCQTKLIVRPPTEPDLAPSAEGNATIRLPTEIPCGATLCAMTSPDAPPASPEFTLERLSHNLYRYRRADGRSVDEDDLRRVARTLVVMPDSLTYPAPPRLAGWHGDQSCQPHECILVGRDDPDRRQEGAIRVEGVAPAEPLALASTAGGAAKDGTAGGVAGEAAAHAPGRRPPSKAGGSAGTVAALVIGGVLLAALAAVVWVLIVPAVLALLGGLSRWLASLSLKERLELAKQLQELTGKKR